MRDDDNYILKERNQDENIDLWYKEDIIMVSPMRDELLFSLAEVVVLVLVLVLVLVDMRLRNVTPAGWLTGGWVTVLHIHNYPPSPGEFSSQQSTHCDSREERRGINTSLSEILLSTFIFIWRKSQVSTLLYMLSSGRPNRIYSELIQRIPDINVHVKDYSVPWHPNYTSTPNECKFPR